MKECCGTCKHNEAEREGIYKLSFYCGNEKSSEYGSPTAYDDSCDDWEEKE